MNGSNDPNQPIQTFTSSGQSDMPDKKKNRKPVCEGRPVGCQNKFTRKFHADIAESYRQRGGIRFLNDLPPEEFVKLLLKIIPQQINADLRGNVKYTIKIVDFSSIEEPIQIETQTNEQKN